MKYFSNRFVDLCHERVPKNQITLMKDVSRMKTGYQDENLFGKAQDILWDEEFYEYARYPKVQFSQNLIKFIFSFSFSFKLRWWITLKVLLDQMLWLCIQCLLISNQILVLIVLVIQYIKYKYIIYTFH